MYLRRQNSCHRPHFQLVQLVGVLVEKLQVLPVLISWNLDVVQRVAIVIWKRAVLHFEFVINDFLHIL